MRRLLVLVTIAATVLVWTGAPADAHGPVGVIQFQAGDQTAPLTVAFRVRLIYANDTEPVNSGATVTVSGTGPGGSVGPVGLAFQGSNGIYAGTVSFPAGGNWSMTFTAVDPAASLSRTQAVTAPAPPPTQAPAPTVTAAPGPTSTTTTAAAPETTVAPETEAPSTEPTPSTDAPATTAVLLTETAAATTDSSGSSTPWLAIVAGVVGAALLAGGALFLMARRS